MASKRSLEGRRVLVTRAEGQAGPLVERLCAHGAEVITIPTIEVELLHPSPSLDRCLERLPEYQWLILTSANGVAALAARIKELKIRAAAFSHMKTVAVGAATAEAMRALGLRVDIVPQNYVAEAVVVAFQSEMTGQNVLLVRGTLARDVIPVALQESGARVDIADAYKTVAPQESIEKIRDLFDSAQPPDIVTFTSSSSVDNFLELIDKAGRKRSNGLLAASIGPITSATLRRHGWEPWVEASLHTSIGLTEAIVAKCASTS